MDGLDCKFRTPLRDSCNNCYAFSDSATALFPRRIRICEHVGLVGDHCHDCLYNLFWLRLRLFYEQIQQLAEQGAAANP